jgi:polyphosphate kinase
MNDASISTSLSATPEACDLTSRARFNNRELSWLAFNERVLAESANPRHPLLERLRFLSIAASNFDEFTMVRIAGLKGQVAAAVTTPSEDGMTPREQLAAITVKIRELADKQQRLWQELVPLLAETGIRVCGIDDLTTDDRGWLHTQFIDQIFPMLTPMAIDP